MHWPISAPSMTTFKIPSSDIQNSDKDILVDQAEVSRYSAEIAFRANTAAEKRHPPAPPQDVATTAK